MEIKLKDSYPCIECGEPTAAYGAFDGTGPLCLECWGKPKAPCKPRVGVYVAGILAAILAAAVLVVVLA